MLSFLTNTAQAVSLPTIGGGQDLPAFISSVYSFALTVVGIAVFIQIVRAGFLWLTAVGDASKAGTAKSMMTNAVIGAILLFGAYMILFTINPDLVKNTFNFSIPGTSQNNLNTGSLNTGATSGNGALAGTPGDGGASFWLPRAYAQAGIHFFTVRVVDANGDSYDQSYSMEIFPSNFVGAVNNPKTKLVGRVRHKEGIVHASSGPLSITTAFIPDGTINKPYYAEIEVAGGAPPYVYSILSDGGENGLPDGLYLLTADEARQLVGSHTYNSSGGSGGGSSSGGGASSSSPLPPPAWCATRDPGCPSSGYSWITDVEVCGGGRAGTCQDNSECGQGGTCWLISNSAAGCNCTGAGGNIVGQCCQKTNPYNYATQSTADILASCLDGKVISDPGSWGPGGFFYTKPDTLTHYIVVSNDVTVNAGLAAKDCRDNDCRVVIADICE